MVNNTRFNTTDARYMSIFHGFKYIAKPNDDII